MEPCFSLYFLHFNLGSFEIELLWQIFIFFGSYPFLLTSGSLSSWEVLWFCTLTPRPETSASSEWHLLTEAATIAAAAMCLVSCLEFWPLLWSKILCYKNRKHLLWYIVMFAINWEFGIKWKICPHKRKKKEELLRILPTSVKKNIKFCSDGTFSNAFFRLHDTCTKNNIAEVYLFFQ